VFSFNQIQTNNIKRTSSSNNEQSRALLNNMISQMSYNDLKKQKIKQTKNLIWSQFMDNCIQSLNDPQTHINNLCKQHKIVL
jgi:hypothetical protein